MTGNAPHDPPCPVPPQSTEPAAGDASADAASPDQAAPFPPVARSSDPNSGEVRVDRRMLESLVCPETEGPLSWDASRQELVSRLAGLAYPVRGGIPILLATEARRLSD